MSIKKERERERECVRERESVCMTTRKMKI